MASARGLAVAGLVLLGANLAAPPMPFRSFKLVLGGLGLLLLAAPFLLERGARPRAQWILLGALVLALLPPLVPYQTRHCSDAPDPGTNEFCRQGRGVSRPLGWTLLAGRADAQGGLSSTAGVPRPGPPRLLQAGPSSWPLWGCAGAACPRPSAEQGGSFPACRAPAPGSGKGDARAAAGAHGHQARRRPCPDESS